MKAPEELQKAVERYRNGEKSYFDQIYKLSHRYLYVCIKHIVKDKEIASDMLQETYLEISRSIEQLRNTEDFLNWAAVISKRKCYAYLNKTDKLFLSDTGNEGGGQEIFESIADDEEFIPESIMQDREKRMMIKNIIDGLSDMQRMCVIGYYYNEQKQEEISDELGIPLNTVKSHLNRAKAKIKEGILALEIKKDTKLYAILPFLLLLFTEEAQECEPVPMPPELKSLMA
ncbi:MAG: sigma-70 family RNA polymerase sigma factor [Lachnospiraceae bacterium]|nr:sigma-70 family RNA polymerase sigma factor [Lachnospiraceae bacterium]